MADQEDDTELSPISDLTVRRHLTDLGLVRDDRPPGDSLDTTVDLQTVSFRPQLRPQVPILWVMDDDQGSGERIRIRVANFIIGRNDGNLTLPHDSQVSGRHAEIERRQEGGRWMFLLRDLSSTNGTFVKIAQSRLENGAEFRVGRQQFSFVNERAVADPDGQSKTGPAVVELTADGEGRAWLLPSREAWIGRDAESCWLTLKDPLVDARHVRLVCDRRGYWYLDDSSSQNGTWLAIQEIQLISGSEFEVGEQRCRFILP